MALPCFFGLVGAAPSRGPETEGFILSPAVFYCSTLSDCYDVFCLPWPIYCVPSLAGFPIEVREGFIMTTLAQSSAPIKAGFDAIASAFLQEAGLPFASVLNAEGILGTDPILFGPPFAPGFSVGAKQLGRVLIRGTLGRCWRAGRSIKQDAIPMRNGPYAMRSRFCRRRM